MHGMLPFHDTEARTTALVRGTFVTVRSTLRNMRDSRWDPREGIEHSPRYERMPREQLDYLDGAGIHNRAVGNAICADPVRASLLEQFQRNFLELPWPRGPHTSHRRGARPHV